ncbi:MAG: N-acetylglucosamine repressor [Bacteroidota bacterium]|jgi:predicted NBD/HSP70 family sugar kinase
MNLKHILEATTDNSLSELKWSTLRRSIIKILLTTGNTTIAELSAELRSSIPTITKAVNELMLQGYVTDMGKVLNSGGRRPSLYSVKADCAYFLGVEVTRSHISIGLQDLKKEFVSIELKHGFILENNPESLDQLCQLVNLFVADAQVDKAKILGACINLSGRINSKEGFSYNYLFDENKPLSDTISTRIGLPVYLENDTRAMAFGEYMEGAVDEEQNILFLNYSYGVGTGIITDGKLYYGKSGYSGEFGHSAIFDNHTLCQCGKLGCLETEVSGWSLVEQFKQALADGKQSKISLPDGLPTIQFQAILSGAMVQEDPLCIDLITEQSQKMGRYLSILLNIFNPDLLVIGGDFSQLGDFVILPIQSALKKYSLSLVNRDMKLKKSLLGSRAGVIGACSIVKEKSFQFL